VHGDLKPSNVLLAEDGPRVVDFGISRAMESIPLMQAALLPGSHGFMSPEQASGREAGNPGDVFSLGAVVAFAATGQAPPTALLYRAGRTSPSLDQVPAEVRPLVERCLARDPCQRPTADSLRTELRATAPAAGWLPESIIRASTAGTATGAALAAAGVSPGSSPETAPGTVEAGLAAQVPAADHQTPALSAADPLVVTSGRLPSAPGVVDDAPGPGGRRCAQRHRRRVAAWVIGGLLAVSAAAGLVRNAAAGDTAGAPVQSPRAAQASTPTASPSVRSAASSASSSPRTSSSATASPSASMSAAASPSASMSAAASPSPSPPRFSPPPASAPRSALPNLPPPASLQRRHPRP
jgi:eukaryotic-like serine/threonine-protein kinase